MSNKLTIFEETIINRIFYSRGRRVMFDFDLAQIYGVETRVLNQAVKRNIKRFPADFMFQITFEEFDILKSQIVTSSSESIDNKGKRNLKSQNMISSWGGSRKLPYVFTEHGTVMLASILNSPVAIEASIYVVRAFVKLRDMLMLHKELADKIKDLEQKTQEQFKGHSEQLQVIFEALKQLINKENDPRKRIGYKLPKE
ncbi:MAG: ORF6N domain-containing protein [Bacteroidales bacterium]